MTFPKFKAQAVVPHLLRLLRERYQTVRYKNNAFIIQNLLPPTQPYNIIFLWGQEPYNVACMYGIIDPTKQK